MTIERDAREEEVPPDLASLGSRLRLARRRASLSQEAVASEIGTTERSISRWELDEVSPSFADVAKLALAYDVSMDWLAGRTQILTVFLPGRVVVDEEAQEIMQELVARSASVADVPESLIRHPGIDYAFQIPRRCLVLSMEAAKAVDQQIQRLFAKLRRDKA